MDTGPDFVLTGHFRRDPFGRTVVDSCISDDEHLRNAITEPGNDRARCRMLLEDLFKGLDGKQGRLDLTISWSEWS
jgi:hypothetical protein